jgi:hypothetical protein
VVEVSRVIRFLRPLPWQANVRAGSAGARLGDPQPGLDCQEQHGVVPPAGPGVLIAGAQESVDLGFGEVADRGPVEPFWWDRQHPGDVLGVFGCCSAAKRNSE